MTATQTVIFVFVVIVLYEAVRQAFCIAFRGNSEYRRMAAEHEKQGARVTQAISRGVSGSKDAV